MNPDSSNKTSDKRYSGFGLRTSLLIILILALTISVNSSQGRSIQNLKTLEVKHNQPYNVLDYAKMLKTDKGTNINEIINNPTAFKSFKNSDISLDPDGDSDFWFLFQVTADVTPIYLTLPLIQNFEIELFRIDSEKPVLISKGGILTPADYKYLNHATELFDLKIAPKKRNIYLLKINRTIYKTFPAQILTSKALFVQSHRNFILEGILIGIILCVVLYHILIYIRVREKEYLLLSLYMFFLIIQIISVTGLLNSILIFENTQWNNVIFNLIPSFSAFFSFWFSYVFLNISKKTHPKTTFIFLSFMGIFILSTIFSILSIPILERLTILVSGFASIFLFAVGIQRYREKFKPSREYLIAYVPTFFSIPYLLLYASGNLSYTWFTHNNLLISITMQAILFSLAIAAKIQILKNENELLLQEENVRLEDMVQNRTSELLKEKEKVENTLSELKAAQSQLIQSEKMASLGELTAGIAHEIQNPLNFVNNFSEVNTELLTELEEERKKEIRDFKNENEILVDIKENESKINHHGKRAESIVKGMLQHSRTNSGEKELTDINALADEYLRLSYHGLRAKDKSFNANFKMELDETLPKINIIQQDMGRVLLNLINNAFYAVDKKAKSFTPQPTKGGEQNPQAQYKPEVRINTISSKSPSGDLGVKISVTDNGSGIPPKIIDKIFQPFFTTKPTGSGTGLGLSLSYDIVKAHGGELKVESIEQKGTSFTIIIPKQHK